MWPWRRGTKSGQDPVTNSEPVRELGRHLSHLYGDDPVGRDDDRLDRKQLAEQLARAIVTVSEQSRSAVVGLVGPWGSGKTSVLGDIEEVLRRKSWYIGHHNPWAYSDFGGAVAGFFSALRDAVPEEILGKEWRESVGAWVSRFAPIGAVGGVAGIDASGAVGVVGALISGDRSPTTLRDKAVEGLTKLEHPVIIVLDDLDRLSPDELLFTFKLVRLLGRLPNVYYLLAYDEETLSDVLQRTELVHDASRAQQYLEKVVQVRLEIPPLLSEQRVDLMNDGIDDLCARFSIEMSADALTRLQTAWAECLATYLDQPRAIKRLFTQIDATWPEVDGEVDFADFVLITFVRTFERQAFDLLLVHRDELLQTQSFYGQEKQTHQDRWNRWVSLLEQAEARYPTMLANLLSELFLPLRSARENMTYGSDFAHDVRRRFGVGSDEYFDRYVQLGVPASDIAEATLTKAIDEMASESPGAALAQVRSWMERDTAKVTAKLARRDEGTALPSRPAMHLLSDFYVTSMDQKWGVVGMSPDWGMLKLATKLLDRLEPDQAEGLVLDVARSGESGLMLAADLIQRTDRADEADVAHAWASASTDAVVALLEEQFQTYGRRPLAESPLATRTMWSLKHLAGEDRIKELNWEMIVNGGWSLQEVLGSLITVGSASNGRSTWAAMGDFSQGSVETLLGLDRVLEALPVRPDDELIEDDDSFDRRRSGVDLETRTEYALNSIERLRRQRSASGNDSTADKPGQSAGPDEAELPIDP